MITSQTGLSHRPGGTNPFWVGMPAVESSTEGQSHTTRQSGPGVRQFGVHMGPNSPIPHNTHCLLFSGQSHRLAQQVHIWCSKCLWGWRKTRMQRRRQGRNKKGQREKGLLSPDPDLQTALGPLQGQGRTGLRQGAWGRKG